MSQAESPAPYTPVEEPNSLISVSKLRILDLICEGPISGFVLQSGAYGSDPLCSTHFDDVQVRNIDGSYNFNASGSGLYMDYRLGTTGQSVIPRFEKIENIVPLSSNTRLALPPAGAGPIKNVIASINTDIYPDADAVKVTVRTPSMYQATTKGDVKTFEIHWAVDVSLNDGPFIQQEQRATIGKCTSNYLSDYTFPLPKTNPPQDYYEWKIRVRRLSVNVMSAAVNNELFVDSICVISNSSFTYPSTALVALELGADQFASIPVRAYEVMGMMMSLPLNYKPTVYHGDGTVTQSIYPEIWNGEFDTEKRWTDNPAWIFYDLLTNKRYGLGKYVKSDWVDKWTLYEIAQYCDELIDNGEGGLEPRFTCNVVLQQRTNAYDLLLNLSSVFRGMLYWANGRLFSTYTNDKSPIFNFTNANVINGQFNYSDTAKNTRSTVVKVRWTNPNNLYRESIEYIEDTDGIIKYGYIEKDITAFACTSKGQALRIANWVLQTEKLLTETVTFQVGLEGNYIRPGDVFNVYDNFRNNNQQGGRIKSFDGTKLELDRAVDLQSGFNYALSVVNPTYNFEATGEITGSNQISQIRNPQIEDKLVTTSAGTNITSLTVNSLYSNIKNGSIWILYSSGNAPSTFLEKTPYRCLALSETAEKNIEILGLIHRTGLNYSTETGYSIKTVPINPVNVETIEPPTNLAIDLVTGLQVNNNFFSYYKISWDATPSSNLAHYIVSGQAPGGSWQKLTSSQATRINYDVNYYGLYSFKVAARSMGGVVSSFISGDAYALNQNPLGGPPRLSGIYISENFDPLLLDNQGHYTGYLGVEPKFNWTLPTGLNGLDDPKTQFLSGYKFDILNPITNSSLLSSPVTLSYYDRAYKLNRGIFNSLIGGQQRNLKIYVETVDNWGNTTSGASLIVNNKAPDTPISSGLFADQENLFYNLAVQPNDAQDLSGIFLWYNTGIIVPGASNANLVTDNLVGTINTQLTSGFNIWYSIIDTFGFSGCNVSGPIRPISTNASVPSGVQKALDDLQAVLTGISSTSGLQLQINSVAQTLSNVITESTDLAADLQTEIINRASGYSGTFSLITGEQYARSTGDSAEALIRSTQISSLSGYSVAYTDNVRTTLVTASGALASSVTSVGIIATGAINAVIAETTARQTGDAYETSVRSTQISSLSGYTNSAISTINTTISNADNALASQISIVGTSGSNNYAALQSEITTRTNADSAEVTNRTNQVSSLSGYTTSSISNVNNTISTTGAALASQINVVNSSLNGTQATVTTLSDALVTGGKAVARWGMTVQAVGGDRAIAGIEMVAANGESPISAVRFLANVLQVCSTTNGTTYYPFQIVSGVTYINEAMIKVASITTAHIQNAAIGTAQIQDLAVANAKIGDITSNNYVENSAGYRIAKSGMAEFAGKFKIGNSTSYLSYESSNLQIHSDDGAGNMFDVNKNLLAINASSKYIYLVPSGGTSNSNPYIGLGGTFDYANLQADRLNIGVYGNANYIGLNKYGLSAYEGANYSTLNKSSLSFNGTQVVGTGLALIGTPAISATFTSNWNADGGNYLTSLYALQSSITSILHRLRTHGLIRT